jgi:beta-lactamase superfamily II metal-dependent hydrolase
MPGTELILQTETSKFMMSVILKTSAGNAVVIDGGRAEDLPLLAELVGASPVKAWILTHPHPDHIAGFIHAVKEGFGNLAPETVYYRFPPLDLVEKYHPKEPKALREFLEIEDRIRPLAVTPKEGDRFAVDELTFTVLLTFEEDDPIVPLRPEDKSSVCNNSSMIFRVEGPNRSVLFLADAGPQEGDRLFARHWRELRSDIVQMAHHGHCGVGPEVYIAAAPESCLWCCADWLYDEDPFVIPDRLCGTRMTRLWMDALGVKHHIVTKDGTQRLPL